MKLWLVEVRLKDWKPSLPDGSRVVDYEEVFAETATEARHLAHHQFHNRTIYEPVLRRKMQEYKLQMADVCTPDCVVLDYDKPCKVARYQVDTRRNP